MIDFRYHALSLVAVFLALGIGILLGVTLGDSLVSEADKGVRKSLRGDVIEAREKEREARAEAAERDRLIDAAVPILLDDRLAAKRVGIVATGDLPAKVRDGTRDAVEGAGGELDSTSALGLPEDLAELARAGGEDAGETVAEPGLAREYGSQVGRSLAAGGDLARAFQDDFPGRFRGDYSGADAIVLYRRPPEDVERDGERRRQREREAASAFELGLIQGLRRDGVTVVGVEQTDTEPSQVEFYEDEGLSSVDNVDQGAGRAALALALAGTRKGSFGVKDSADRPLPDPAR